MESSISEASRTFDQYRERARRLEDVSSRLAHAENVSSRHAYAEDVSSRHAHAAGKSYAAPERIRESLRGEVTWTSRRCEKLTMSDADATMSSDENSTFDALMRNLEQSRAKVSFSLLLLA